ncbi:alpha-amylase [Mucilaginibacter sp. UR6-1]|uniref:alpha-amylase family glycosyl hydrolase n=1 Tax=Mucilaginibacter sp. UR6-1 TaxID=1435643 RepID=UPI001E3A9ACD|nr:alpha-amylase family glycosyl hydrolase [Mucilaginibacter sp. UR6-1]MCC8411095.1 alpha-amylase [Mucilaginibacter sp. UR6-1]
MKLIYKLSFIAFLLVNVACKKSDPVTTIEPPAPSTEIPNNAGDGVTFINNGKSAIFNLYAPGKISVSVIGDFNDWQPTKMKTTTDGTRWWVQVDGLDANTEYAYQYLINGNLRVADPYTEKILDPDNDKYIPASVYPNLKAYPTGRTTSIVSVMQANQPSYTWQVNNFTRPAKKDLVVYELLVRDFVADHSYKTIIDTLDYISRLGVNAIELMPVAEFEGNESWGYNDSFFFAPDKYYGTKNDLKALVDACHQRGIAVIMDIVLNHAFGSSPMVRMYFDQSTGKPTASNPWFNVDAKHPFNVGFDFNHESAATKYFSKNVMKHWLKEYKIDGYRFDLSKGFTQTNNPNDVNAWSAYDASRVAIWKDYNSFIKSVDPNAYVILEHFAAQQEEKELAADGMMLWNNLAYGFQEANMGWMNSSDFSWLMPAAHTFTVSDALVGYAESHDEERVMFKNITYGNQDGYNARLLNNGLKRGAMTAAFLMAAPGPKMVWQFGELGYDISIDQNGRTGNKPILWNYQSVPERKALYNAYAKYIKMKLKNPVFGTNTATYTLTGAVKNMALSSSGVDVQVVGNYDVTAQTANIQFTKTGTWYDYVTGSTLNVTGTTMSLTLQPGEYHIYSSAQLQ